MWDKLYFEWNYPVEDFKDILVKFKAYTSATFEKSGDKWICVFRSGIILVAHTLLLIEIIH